jgi:Ca2+:H+ antiporter
MRRLLPWLIAGLPVALAIRLLRGSPVLTFVAAAIALVPLAAWIGESTEHLATRLGAGLGGLLNATFGNAAEIIISIFALRRGLVVLVKASLTGSIIGNLLLILGTSLVVGGARHGSQRFDAKAVGRHAAMMILAVSAMVLPAVFALFESSPPVREEVSIGVSILLLLTYVAYLYYSYFSAQTRARREAVRALGRPSGRSWTVRRSMGTLAGAILGTVVASELLVEAVEGVTRSLRLSPFFIGVIVVPIIGNVAEHYAAVDFARRNRLELSLSVAANSSTQIAVFVAPLLVLISLAFHPMDLGFQALELGILLASTAIFSFISLDGETNWLEGVQLLALYLIAAVAFFFLPA